MTAPPTARRDRLLAEAARLFAARGFHAVSLDELGAAVGISGPAIYKHFANKDAVLGAVLVGISEHLLADARAVVDRSPDPDAALVELIAAHTAFALSRPELILVQDRDLASLSAPLAHRVRSLQRAYVEIWVDVLRRRDPTWSATDARSAAHAVFGLLNSTPHSARPAGDVPATGALLRRMALAALTRPQGYSR